MTGLLIGDVAKRTGVTPATIRYYESIGLLPSPARSNAGYRRYSEATVVELEFIKKAQGLGFSLEEVHEILRLSRRGEAPCEHVLELAVRHLVAVEERIAQLAEFRDELAADIASWKELNARNESYCDGVCQFIAGAPEKTAPVALHSKMERRPAHPRGRSKTS
jgi:MerR family transcriptional regulator, copper efflux regulator